MAAVRWARPRPAARHRRWQHARHADREAPPLARRAHVLAAGQAPAGHGGESEGLSIGCRYPRVPSGHRRRLLELDAARCGAGPWRGARTGRRSARLVRTRFRRRAAQPSGSRHLRAEDRRVQGCARPALRRARADATPGAGSRRARASGSTPTHGCSARRVCSAPSSRNAWDGHRCDSGHHPRPDGPDPRAGARESLPRARSCSTS